MRYDDPELRDKLAAEYVLGTMPIRVRRRFERLLAADPELVRAVEAWTTRFVAIDRGSPAEPPPARVWRAIERRLGPAPPPLQPGWLGTLAFWRSAALAAAAAAALAILYIAVWAPPARTSIVAILSDEAGMPGWITLGGPGRSDVAIAPITAIAIDPGHSFELWGIADGPPQPLGLLAATPGQPLLVDAAALPPPGGVLAISLEPQGGSPTGLPTGPVRYKGTVLAR
jgi:anti-sigma-K factor RskA